MTLSLVGLEIVVNHAPGHTEGSVAFRMPLDPPNSAQGQSKTGAAETPGEAEGQSAAEGPSAPEAPRAPAGDPGGILFSGDLLFAGSIGRTDLPGGDYPTILRSLARVCLTLPDETVVLSGHGPQTTIGAERRTNPFLTGLTPQSGPRRGL
jgi:glyoxylase-like metal-dependent hydrolase (beta-lactamase superfamily II)